MSKDIYIDFEYIEAEYSAYYVVRARTLADLQTMVSRFMRRGWKLQGGVSNLEIKGHTFYAQAIKGVKS